MEFGKLPIEMLSVADLSLPADPVFNKNILPGRNSASPKVWIGCAKWGRPEWIGKIYPENIREKDFLNSYVQQFNSIELNATGYKMPSVSLVESWKKAAGNKEFLFCPKLTRYILPGPDKEKEQRYLQQFLDAVHHFKTHLGPLYLVLKSYSPAKAALLYSFLFDFPREHTLFIELRHPQWFSDPDIFKTLIRELSLNNTGLIITDTAGRRDVVHMHLTIPKAFVRFVGNSLHPSDLRRCDEWVTRIQKWLASGLKELYFFMHMHDERYSPELVTYFTDQLNKKCALNLKVPEWYGPLHFKPS